ncbi:MAG: putative toxin-antitoxin system toxin component, PIN family [Coriobacteriia bacterium]|nr:putative toxin-antitoxin system toxin component, PIN family [Coriobacteriia bacterium]
MLDTNILVSAALFPKSVSAKAYVKAVSPPHDSLVCDYVVAELERVFNEKFPHKLDKYRYFIAQMALSIEIVPTPPQSRRDKREDQIRDTKDRPILRAALAQNVDVFITGDKDFLEAGLEVPRVLSAAEFLRT